MDPQRLRSLTAPDHEATERLMPLMDPALTRARYAQVLAAIYPLVAGWEAFTAAHCPAGLRLLTAGRVRTPMLAADLTALNHPIPAPQPFPAEKVPAIGTEPGFLGALYVMEGSTLGGQHIARHVEPLLDLTPTHGTQYFRGYGDGTGTMWKAVQAAIAALPASDDATLVTAAQAMFSVFRSAILPLSPAEADQ